VTGHIDHQIRVTPFGISVGPPVCKFCGQDSSASANGPPHLCAGLAAALHAERVVEAVRLLEGSGYRVVPPGVGGHDPL
jgi:hypothetical protein